MLRARRRILPSLVLLSGVSLAGCGPDGARSPLPEHPLDRGKPAEAVEEAPRYGAAELAALSASAVGSAEGASLPAWRAVAAEADEALGLADPEARLAAIAGFVDRHPEHQRSAELLDVWIQERAAGSDVSDPSFADLIDRRAAHPATSRKRLGELVEEYHLPKGCLAPQRGLALVERWRARVEADAKSLPEPSDRQRVMMHLRVQWARKAIDTAEARLLLAAGRTEEALARLDAVDAALDSLGRGAFGHDAAGERRQVFASGSGDPAALLRAAALHAKGELEGARAALGRCHGLLDDPELIALYERLGRELGQELPALAAVIGDPRPAPDFTLEALGGGKVKLSSLRGKIVILTFWATWCDPCRRELPELQRFAERYPKDVVLLAISSDRFADRGKIVPMLEKERLDLKVLYDDPEQLTGYEYTMIPSLYVVDREGRIVHARTGFDPHLRTKLDQEIAPMIEGGEGGEGGGRPLLTLHAAPEGWGVRTKIPLETGVDALAVAPGKIWTVTRAGLQAYSPTGAALGAVQPLEGWVTGLESGDLDGDGEAEVIVLKWGELEVRDGEGKLYWSTKGESGLNSLSFGSLQAGGPPRIAAADGTQVRVWGALPEPLFTAGPFAKVEGLAVGADGRIVFRDEEALLEIDGAGRVSKAAFTIPPGRDLAGRVVGGDGQGLTLLTSPYERDPAVSGDLDGNGRRDLLVQGGNGLVAYDGSGAQTLWLRTHDAMLSTAAVGSIDGGGAVLALAIDKFGVVLLGPPAASGGEEGSAR